MAMPMNSSSFLVDVQYAGLRDPNALDSAAGAPATDAVRRNVLEPELADDRLEVLPGAVPATDYKVDEIFARESCKQMPVVSFQPRTTWMSAGE